MYQIGSSTITFTSRFVMTLSEMKKGDCFTIKSSYSTETLSLDDINNLVSIWSFTEQDSIVSRFKYDDSANEGFGKVKLSVDKHEKIDIDDKGVEVGKSVVYTVNVEAIEDIAANSVLRLGTVVPDVVEEVPEEETPIEEGVETGEGVVEEIE